MRVSTGVSLPAVIVALALAVFSANSGRAEPRENPNLGAGDWTLSGMRVTTTPAMSYLHTTFTATLDDMGNVVHEVNELFDALREAEVNWFENGAGYVMFVYKGMQTDRSKPFQLSIGITVPAGTKPIGKYEVSDLPEFKSASALFNGPLMAIGGAYQRHYTDLFAAGHQPIDENRELYLYWEGEQSNNNVVWIQVGLQ